MSDPYNATTLDAELRAAGLEIHGCSSRGRIDWKNPPTPQEEATAAAVLTEHDKTKLSTQEAFFKNMKAKRRAGQLLTPEEQAKIMDMFLGV